MFADSLLWKEEILRNIEHLAEGRGFEAIVKIARRIVDDARSITGLERFLSTAPSKLGKPLVRVRLALLCDNDEGLLIRTLEGVRDELSARRLQLIQELSRRR